MHCSSSLVLFLIVFACASQAVMVQAEAVKPVPTPIAPLTIQPTAPSFDESLLRGKEYLLEVRSPFVPVVRDPVLGPLGTNQPLAKAVEKFFLGVVQDNLDPATLEPRWAVYLRSWAKRAREAGMGQGLLRLGVPLPSSSEELMVPYRWIEAQREHTGWVVLVQEGTSYRISDVQSSGPGPRANPFDPESPQEISSPSLR